MLLGIEFPIERLWLESETDPDLITGVFSLTTRSRERVQCGVVTGPRLIGSIMEVARRRA